MDKPSQRVAAPTTSGRASREKTRSQQNASNKHDKSKPLATGGRDETKKRSGSKFNRLLSNIERSIKSQFGGNGSQQQQQQQQVSVNKSQAKATTTSSAPTTPIRFHNKPKAPVAPPSQTATTTIAAAAAKVESHQKQKQITSISSPIMSSSSSSNAINIHTNPIERGNVTNLTTLRLASQKLSIPPPHANDEARNQSHRVLFGATIVDNDSRHQSNLASEPPQRVNSCITKLQHDELSAKIEAIRLNASPASSSARSLPATSSTGVKSQRSQLGQANSGASTSNNNNNSSNNNGSNMILIRANQNLNNGHSNQQQQPHHLQMYQQRVMPPQQQQPFASNQVPIMSNNTHQQLISANNMSLQFHNNNIYSNTPAGGHLQLATSGGQPQQQQSQQIMANIDQQIYANAPPKPRRYQYYNYTNAFPVIQPAQQQQPFQAHQQVVPHINLQQSSTNQNVVMYQQMNQELQQNGFYMQQRLAHAPYLMSKSKSSLDAGDLVRFKSESRLNTMNSNQPLRQHQQHQQPIYGTLSRNQLNGFNPMATMYHQQPLQSQDQGNLQRSKSVSHLLQPLYNQTSTIGRHPQPQQQQQQQHQQQARYQDYHQIQYPQQGQQINNKFLSVSSASTTNLSLIGASHSSGNTYNIPELDLSASGGFVKAPSSHHINVMGISQQQQQQHQAPSSTSTAGQLFLTSALRQQHFNMRGQQQYHPTAMSNAATSVSTTSAPSAIANNATSAGNLFSNGGNKLQFVRQQAQQRNSPNISIGQYNQNHRVSLDDKIRHLLIGGDQCDSSATGGGAGGSPLASKQQYNSLYQQHYPSGTSNYANESATQSTTWTAKQMAPLGERQLHLARPQQNQQADLQFHSNESHQQHQQQQQQRQLPVDMGNRQQRHYAIGSANNGQVGVPTNLAASVDLDNQQQQQIYQSTTSGQTTNTSYRQLHHESSPPTTTVAPTTSASGSHLIVDLTTPRVLAKTQTNLMQAPPKTDTSSWSINQVGLPAPSASQQAQQQHQQQPPVSSNPSMSPSVPSGGSSSSSNNSPHSSKSTASPSSSNNLERTAPYYYSDLKSAEQRQALLAIAQQKSLSPPPQLLSRSVDQSSTRLTSKSATMHPNHARTLSGGLANRQRLDRSSMKDSGLRGYGDQVANSASVSNIAKNIDRLFDEDRRETNNLKGSKDFSKSKSLENISQKSGDSGSNNNNNLMMLVVTEGQVSNGNPVYQNIRQSDKLLSAINSSTTCLSTSSSRKQTNAARKQQQQQQTLVSNSDESMDSILGSSLDESDLEFDENNTTIEDIKLSSTENHLADISQLIEQLRSNHSKLTEEYKSTLVRISRTINSRNNGHDLQRSEKLARRLQLLELKSKKCESRSNNQLALIQMLEKVLKQSKEQQQQQQQHESLSSTASTLTSGHKPPSSTFDSNENQMPGGRRDPQVAAGGATSTSSSSTSSPSQSLANASRDVKGEKGKNQSASERAAAAAAATTTTSSSDQTSKSSGGQLRTKPGIIKAVVTELRDIVEVKRLPESQTNSSSVGKRVFDIEQRKVSQGKNPFNSRGNDDDSDSISSVSISSLGEKSTSGLNDVAITENQVANTNGYSNNNNNSYDDDDFIEYLSTDGSHGHKGSQFEASQFCVSDYNSNSSSTTYNGNSSKSSNSIGESSGASSTGEATSGESLGSPVTNSNNNNNNNNNQDKTLSKSHHKKAPTEDDYHEMESLFNDILGNVVDVVDVSQERANGNGSSPAVAPTTIKPIN